MLVSDVCAACWVDSVIDGVHAPGDVPAEVYPLLPLRLRQGGSGMKPAAYAMTLKDGSTWTLSADGDVLYDGTRGMTFKADGSWRVIGFTTRHIGRTLISLADAAAGANLGQGWVHDLDHGAHRLWGMPVSQRVVRVTKI